MNFFIQAVCTLIFIISLCTTKNALSDNLHSGSTSIQKSICYVTSSNKSIFLPSLKGDYLVYGYRMAIEDHFKISGRKYKLKEFISEDTTASLLTALKSASQTDCLLIVGLFTSYEALIAGSFLEKEKISGFSPVATHNDINKYFPYFRTGMASASTYIDAMTNFVLKSKKNKAILFSNNDDVYSSFFADELKNNISDFISVNHFVNDLLNPTLFELSGT